MTDFSKILESDTFTFLVGPDKKPLRIHSALAKGLSEPLNIMMNGGVGGKMQDAIQMKASLENVDPQTFVHFCEFAYSGMYRAPAKTASKPQKAVSSPETTLATSQVPAASTTPAPQPSSSFGRPLSQSNLISERPSSHPAFPFRTPPHQPSSAFGAPTRQSPFTANERSPTSFSNLFGGTAAPNAAEVYCHGCGRPKGGHSVFRDSCEGSSYCSRHGSRYSCIQCGAMTGLADRKYCPNCLPGQSPRALLSDLGREYPALGMSHSGLRQYLNSLRPVDPISDCLSCHAKLFVFANTFMIESLKKLCLHKLCRDLEQFQLKQGNISEVVEMMSYAYDNTSEGEGGGVGQELRELVLAYAALKAKDLTKYKEFRDMLTEGGELAAAFACAMANRLSA